MKMNDTDQFLSDDEGEETMVSPRFDDEETVLARPVVPLEEVGEAPAVVAEPVPAAAEAAIPPTAETPPLYSRLRAAPRRSLVAGLVLVSVLAGSVLGVGGLYFYQKHRSADASAPPAEQQKQADAPEHAEQRPTAEPDSQGREANAPAAAEPSSPAPVASEKGSRADVDDAADSAKDRGSEEADARPSVVERRAVPEDRAPAVLTPKHAKKGARDAEPQREERRARRDEEDEQLSRGDEANNDRREARRVGVITYRPRRVRRGNYDSPDRLRRIFEGQP